MTHLSAFDGLLGFATLHPLFTFGPLLLASFIAAAALRRRPAPQAVRARVRA
jgi:hypothetical protein